MNAGAGPTEWCCLGLALASGLAYAVGLRRLWARAGVGRGVSRAQAALFAIGWSCATLPALSSLHALGGRSFAAHMIEHELLIVVAAPLLVLARPLPVFAWALNRTSARRRIRRFTHPSSPQTLWHALTHPLVATLLHALALWAWHLPGLFRAALADPLLHFAQHLCFFVTALLFWWSVISREARRRWPVAASLALFATLVHSSSLGALLTFTQNYWYPELPYAAIGFCGLNSVEDQQLAGLVMWIPGGLAYFIAALWLLWRPLRGDDSAAGVAA